MTCLPTLSLINCFKVDAKTFHNLGISNSGKKIHQHVNEKLSRIQFLLNLVMLRAIMLLFSPFFEFINYGVSKF